MSDIILRSQIQNITNYIETPKYQKSSLTCPNFFKLMPFNRPLWDRTFVLAIIFWRNFYASYIQFIFWKKKLQYTKISIVPLKFKTIGRFSDFRSEDLLELDYMSRNYMSWNYMSRNYMSRNYMKCYWAILNISLSSRDFWFHSNRMYKFFQSAKNGEFQLNITFLFIIFFLVLFKGLTKPVAIKTHLPHMTTLFSNFTLFLNVFEI